MDSPSARHESRAIPIKRQAAIEQELRLVRLGDVQTGAAHRSDNAEVAVETDLAALPSVAIPSRETLARGQQVAPRKDGRKSKEDATGSHCARCDGLFFI